MFEEDLKMFAPLNMRRGLTEDQIRATEDPMKAPFAGLPTLEEAVAQGAWLCGPPETIIESLMAIQSMYPGMEEINMGHAVGTSQSVILEQLERFAKEVMPTFKNQVAEPDPADK